MKSTVINFLLPSRCVVCNKVLANDAQICLECFNSLVFITKPFCKKCGYPFVEGEDGDLCAKCISSPDKQINLTRSALMYDDISKKMIIDLKFYDKTSNLKIFGYWLSLAAIDILESGVDVIVPVPLHFVRLLKRKYNQAGLLAKELGKISGISVDHTSLKKKKYTRPQTKFSLKRRRVNVRGSFVVKDNANIKGKKVLLLDDVMTTGSTLKECAKTLIKAGAKEVNVITLARVL